MKWLILKSTIFSILVLIGLSSLNSFFLDIGEATFAFKDYKKMEGEVKVAIFGTSHAYSSYNPKTFEKRLKLKAFNFGTSLQSAEVVRSTFSEIQKNNELELIIVDVFSQSLVDIKPKNEFLKSFQIRALDNLEMSFIKLEAFYSIFSLKETPMLSPFIRNHARWNTILKEKEYQIKSEMYYYNGFHAKKKYDSIEFEQVKMGLEKKNRNYPVEKLKPSELKRLEDMVNYFLDSNIPVVFVSAPFDTKIRGSKYEDYKTLISAYFSERGIPFLDFNKSLEAINLSKVDFSDPDHLNVTGAEKVTMYLIDYIENNKLRYHKSL